MPSWIALHPQWFLRELDLLRRHYHKFRIDERQLDRGDLVLWGELKVRPPGGTQSHPIKVSYPEGTPYEHPIVLPIENLPDFDSAASPKYSPKFFDRRHQMPDGNLCLFQRETRTHAGGDTMDILQILRRAEQWFMGLHTGLWPPDTADSELESHFRYASDVLLAARFFGDDVHGHGRFYMLPDLRRMFDASPDFKDGCPMIVTAMTEESGIIKLFDARNELADLYPWIENDLWDPIKLAAQTNRKLGQLGQPEQGYWWTLPSEPSPFHNGEGLLETLKVVAPDGDAWKLITGTLNSELSTVDRHYIALQYPARAGGIEWLFLVLPHTQKRAGGGIILGRDTRKEFGESSVLCYRAYSIQNEDLWRRNETVVDRTIQRKTVALIGLGALGSRVAELLAQAGVGRFRLCDSDRLKTVNVARHIGGISDFGASKVRVVYSRLLNINPRLLFLNGDLMPANADDNLDRLQKFMSEADLVISTTADESVESVINQIAVMLRKPVLYARSLRRASMGRAFLVRPGIDACKSCLAGYAYAGRNGKSVPADWIDIPETEGDVLLHECGRPVIAGSAADLSFISTLTARIAIDFLEGTDDSTNHWVWTRAAAADLNPKLGATLSTFSGTVPPSDECPICREPPIVEVVLDDALGQFIVDEVEASPTVETGGVLLGYVDANRHVVVTRVTGPGPNAIKTATRFHRDVEYIQAEIDRAARDLGEKGVYIGEWHSHLERAPEPSPIDVRSLSEISTAPHYLTTKPVLVIAAYDPLVKKVVTLRSWVFVAGGRFYRVPNSADAG